MTIVEAFKMTCQHASLLHEKKREGKLTAMEGFGLWWHASVICRFCRLFFTQTELLRKATAHMSQKEDLMQMPAGAKRALEQRFQQELKK